MVDESETTFIGIVMFNHSNTVFEVKYGDRVAQLICERIFHPILKEMQELSETNRGTNGFGSTDTSFTEIQ